MSLKHLKSAGLVILCLLLLLAGTAQGEEGSSSPIARLLPRAGQGAQALLIDENGQAVQLTILSGPDGQEVFRLGEILSGLKFPYAWDGATRTAVVNPASEGSAVRVTAGAARFGSEDRVGVLPRPVELLGGDLVIAPESAERFLSFLCGKPARWNSTARVMTIGAASAISEPAQIAALQDPAPRSSERDTPPPATASPHFLRTIVLDPGHGGRDPGAVGPTGLEEKTVTLAVARLVRDRLQREFPETQTLLTRDGDRYVSLSDRVQFAARNEADLFVSIHFNSFTANSHGTETYYFGDPSDEDAARVARLEGVFDPSQGMGTDLDKMLIDMRLNANIVESVEFAQKVQRSLVDEINLSDRGVKSARFYVLHYGVIHGIPSILVEVAFLSNPREEALSRDSAFIEKAAEGVFEGMMKFIQELERMYPGGAGWRDE